ncbi:MAG TPA: hypothetical protein VJ859_03350 [Allosphingosinicella sp.]|nr:hypothetical protein [Allosphingosinicella sp.]
MPKRPVPSFMVFTDQQGRWHWNFADSGGNIVAIGNGAFKHPAGCAKAIRALLNVGSAPVLVRDAVFRPLTAGSAPQLEESDDPAVAQPVSLEDG